MIKKEPAGVPKGNWWTDSNGNTIRISGYRKHIEVAPTPIRSGRAKRILKRIRGF